MALHHTHTLNTTGIALHRWYNGHLGLRQSRQQQALAKKKSPIQPDQQHLFTHMISTINHQASDEVTIGDSSAQHMMMMPSLF